MRDRNADAVEWIDRAPSLPGADADPGLRVIVLCIQAWSLGQLSRRAEQAAVMDQAGAIARVLAEPALLSRTLQSRAAHATIAGLIDVAGPLAEEALDWGRIAGDDTAIAMASFSYAIAARNADELRERVQRAASCCRRSATCTT